MGTTTVSFNDEDQAKFSGLQSSKSFSQFVKNAFYDAVDREKARKVDLTNETIQRLAAEAIERETKRAISP